MVYKPALSVAIEGTFKWVAGELVPISSSLWARGRVHPGQVASPSQGNTQTTTHTLIHTPKGNLELPINLTGMSLDCGRKPEYPGIEITSTSSSNHYVTGKAAEPSTDAYLRILSGDEVIQVNDQIVVGWSRANLIKKLRENPNGVTLVLKKIAGTVQHKHSIQIPIVKVSDFLRARLHTTNRFKKQF
ncbi:hypothetical protein AMECASPLE_028781 [Ameca splendens]|uniref:PDZ domain-containing protein n=1 Tax=Ameca splendens TaxID=208324 RepID=A0ABV0XUS5_9TELE